MPALFATVLRRGTVITRAGGGAQHLVMHRLLRRGRRLARRRHFRLSKRKKYGTAGAVMYLVGTAANAQLALMLLYDSLAHPQSQACALGFFGSEKRLK